MGKEKHTLILATNLNNTNTNQLESYLVLHDEVIIVIVQSEISKGWIHII